ncbi:MAG TPA: DUF559 domain-containing protein [Stellaceae bacterium]|nr:DUF559 domain-containing protein [Stellaceae bacterium]
MRSKNQRRVERARSLRHALTPAEFALWTRIRGRQLGGFKFVRQEPIDRYYVDFVCRERGLIIELDGGQSCGTPRRRAARQRAMRPWLSRAPHLEPRCDRESGWGSPSALVRTRKTAPHPVPLPASGARVIRLAGG